MNELKVHFLTGDAGTPPPCNMVGDQPARSTAIPGEVTCVLCKRTGAFKSAARGLAEPDNPRPCGDVAARPVDHPLNAILYGPPGTGKTYATFRRCVQICDGSVAGKEDEEVQARYRELVEEKRVEFITFHQSYGYEEFVEGLRPETEGDSGGLRLKVRDGVLKRIAKRARSSPAPDTKKRRFVKIQLSGQDVFEECMKDDCVRFGPSKGWSDEDLSDARYGTYDGCLNCFEERLGRGSKRWWNATSAATFRAWLDRGDIVVVPDGHSKSEYRAVGEIVGDYEYALRSSSPLWPHRRAVRWHWRAKGNPSPVRDFQDKRFGGQLAHELRPSRPEVLLQHLQQDFQRQPYVLVIDEINRANIAKVLGELITLLEEDKREGAENEIAVTLPHSEESFTLPANLHVLGTMNTADRSIALLDTALRRRFVFEEITPDASLLEDVKNSTGVDLPAVLDTMNDRLEWLVGRDHLIGHAWFLRAKSRADVDEVMRRKVIPLIAEYFYDDWEKVRAVLGGTDAFVQGHELEPPPDLDGGGERRSR
ncbi:MAG: AAA family ATPase [Gemmatimonadetes bacterium]|nr:AAA family ATPase [Gemmatimonadota bacterium]